MTLEYADDFGMAVGDLAICGWNVSNGPAVIAAGPWGAGSYALQASAAVNFSAQRALAPAATRYLGVRIKLPSLPAAGQSVMLLHLDNDTSIPVSVFVDSGGHIGLWTCDRTAFYSASAPIVAGAWFYLELMARCTDAGAYDVHVNNVSVLSGAADLHWTGLSASTFLTLGTYNAYMNVMPGTLWADLYTSLTGFLGDTRMVPFVPSGLGLEGFSGGVVGAATEWQAIVTQDGDTSYAYSSTPGDVVSASHAALPLVPGGIIALVVHVVARKDDAGARTIDGVARQGSTVGASGAPASLTTSYVDYPFILPTDPAGAEWTFPHVATAEIGAEVAA